MVPQARSVSRRIAGAAKDVGRLLSVAAFFNSQSLIAQEPPPSETHAEASAIESSGLQEVLPELGEPDLPAQPFEELPAISTPASSRYHFELPPVARFLIPKAVPVPLVRASAFDFEGNTVFSDEELSAKASAFIAKDLDPEGLAHLRHVLTQAYVEAGYINSGASVAEGSISKDGVMKVKITEGRLSKVLVDGNGGLSDRYIADRLVSGDRPLHFATLQRRLQVLQANSNIIRLNAELKPGLVPGEALLMLDVEEYRRWTWGVDFHNQRSPSVGAEQVDLWMENTNLTGTSDRFNLRLGLFSGSPEELHLAGLDNLYVSYQRPLLPDDTSWVVSWGQEDYSILEEPFRNLSIEGSSWTVLTGLRRPVYRDLENDAWISIMLERSHDETSLFGRPFSISPGSVNGNLDLSILELGGEWTRRTPQSVLVVRGSLNCGLEAFGATEYPGEPNGKFLFGAMEAQYSWRFSEREDMFILHAGIQATNDNLPPPAQFRIGGRYTVRGYRENKLVRDNGVFGGLEYQFPLLTDAGSQKWDLSLLSFVEGGTGWNHGDEQRESLASAGLGLRVLRGASFSGELYWGIPLTNRDKQSDDLQDHEIHFRISYRNL